MYLVYIITMLFLVWQTVVSTGYNFTQSQLNAAQLDTAQLYTSTTRHSTTRHVKSQDGTTRYRPHGRKVEVAIE